MLSINLLSTVKMSVETLRAALESEKSVLQQVDASIKRIVQAPIPRYNNSQHDRYNSNGTDATRPRSGGEELGKRRHDAKTVFSRLSRNGPDSDTEEPGLKKLRLSSHVTRDFPTKQEIMKVQCGDEEAKVRNRRMFGSLLGTLQRFKRDELSLKSQEEKKAQVERRIEEQAKNEQEQHKRERQRLFSERETRKARIRALEAKLARASEWEAWAAAQRPLGNFVRTRAAPPLCWKPKLVDERARALLEEAAKVHNKMLENKQKELEDELKRIEEKFIRNARTQETKENDNRNEEDSGSDGEEKDRRSKIHSRVEPKQENGSGKGEKEDSEDRRVQTENNSAGEEEERMEVNEVHEEDKEEHEKETELEKSQLEKGEDGSSQKDDSA